MLNKEAQELGRKGGQARSEAKTAAARENAKKPRKKWVTAIAYEVAGVEKPFAFGSVITRGAPPKSQDEHFRWVCDKLRSEGVGLRDVEDFSFLQLSTTSIKV